MITHINIQSARARVNKNQIWRTTLLVDGINFKRNKNNKSRYGYVLKITDAKFNVLRRDKQISEAIAMLRSIMRRPYIHEYEEERNRIDDERKNIHLSIKDLQNLIKNEYLLDHLNIDLIKKAKDLLSVFIYRRDNLLKTGRIRVGKYTVRNRWIKEILMCLISLNEGAQYETVYQKNEIINGEAVISKSKKVLTKKFKGKISRIEREDFVYKLIVKYNLQRYRSLGKPSAVEKRKIKESYGDNEQSIRRQIRDFDYKIRKI